MRNVTSTWCRMRSMKMLLQNRMEKLLNMKRMLVGVQLPVWMLICTEGVGQEALAFRRKELESVHIEILQGSVASW